MIEFVRKEHGDSWEAAGTYKTWQLSCFQSLLTVLFQEKKIAISGQTRAWRNTNFITVLKTVNK